ncbi:DUF551 domain-containing protein [Cronobacter sakazakii]|nr:DUF551 domain-containing protein [Cronobacter sakazakii]
MDWIKFNGDPLKRGTYLVCTKNRQVIPMQYTWNEYAKTERGKAPRFEYMGRISPWEITHYMHLPEPPAE